jgi:uncharacterized low-complexity protein
MLIYMSMKNLPIKSVSQVALAIAGLTLVAAVGWPVAARAAQGQDKSAAADQSTPKGWSWEIKDGKRVPKGTRKVGADGSSREEVRVGSCLTIKEKSADGVYKESRRCD